MQLSHTFFLQSQHCVCRISILPSLKNVPLQTLSQVYLDKRKCQPANGESFALLYFVLLMFRLLGKQLIPSEESGIQMISKETEPVGDKVAERNDLLEDVETDAGTELSMCVFYLIKLWKSFDELVPSHTVLM